MLPPEMDVIAYDENMGVIFGWSGCPEVTELKELPSQGLAHMAIEQAHLIRRRDGLVLKGPDGDPMDAMGDEIVMPIDEPKAKRVELKRVDLIPPPEELPEHEALTNDQLVKVALWKALMWLDEESLPIEDSDIVKALSFGRISIERSTDGVVVFRAHLGSLDVIEIADEAPRPRKRAQKKPSA